MRVDENTDHVVSGFSKLAQISDMCTNCMGLSDSSFHTQYAMKIRRPDLVVVDKKDRTCEIIDFVIFRDIMIKDKENQQIWRSC